MPVHDEGRLVRGAVRSVMRQSANAWELLIVDDNSAPQTASILDDLAASDSRVRLLRNPSAQGAALSRYRGIQASRGEYITFLDADDRLYPQALGSMLRAAEESGCGIVAGRVRLYFPRLRFAVGYFTPGNLSADGALAGLLRNEGYLPVCWGKLFHAELLRPLPHTADVRAGEDFLFNLQLLLGRMTSVRAIDSDVYRWRYSGLGEKYFLRDWNEYKQSMEIAARMVGEDAVLQEFLNTGYRKNLRERVIQLHLKGKECCGCADWDEAFSKNSLEYLRTHRKFYNFMRLMQKLHGL